MIGLGLRLERERYNGFTLMELMIVVAIMGLLVGLALPAFLHVQAIANQAKCSTQLRQVYVGASLYSSEHNQLYLAVTSYAPAPSMPATPIPGSWWWCLSGSPLADYVGGISNLQKIAICPLNRTATNTSVGCPGWPYLANYNVMANTGFPLKRLSDIPNPANTIMMTDGVRGGSNWGFGFASTTSGWWRVSTNHLEKANMLWCDGHISQEKANNIQSEQVVLQ